MMDMNVREARNADVNKIEEVALSSFRHDYEKFKGGISLEYFQDLINSRFNGLYVAEADSKVVGFAIYIPITLIGTFELVAMGIIKEFRGRGIGTELLSKSRELYAKKLRLKGISVHSMYLTTGEDNPVAQRLYENLSFERTGVIKDTICGIGNVETVMTYYFDKNKIYKGANKSRLKGKDKRG